MEKFEINILGCGAALPTPRRLSSSQIVNIREKLFMLDCAEGTQMALRRSRLPFSHLQAIFLTHLHGDHTFGLIGMLSTSMVPRTCNAFSNHKSTTSVPIPPTTSSFTKSTPTPPKPSMKTVPSAFRHYLFHIVYLAAATFSARSPHRATSAAT